MVSLKEKSNIPPDQNIHAFDLFENEKVRLDGKKITFLKINTFFKRLSSLIEGANMQSIILTVDRRPYKAILDKTLKRKGGTQKALIKYLKRHNLHDFLYEALARKLVLEFGHFLEKENAHGEVIAESRRHEDETVLRAFILATYESTYNEEPRYRAWAQSSFKRINSLTFQNKKGLSFGLEIADLFGWAYLNEKFGRAFPISSHSKITRVEARLKTISRMIQLSLFGKPENMTPSKLRTVAGDRVSEFTKAISEYRVQANCSLFGDPTR